MPLMSLNLTKPNTRKYSFMLRGTYINSFKLPFYGLPLLFVRYTRRRLNSKRVKREYLHKEKQQKKTFCDKSHRQKRNTVELLKSRVKLESSR